MEVEYRFEFSISENLEVSSLWSEDRALFVDQLDRGQKSNLVLFNYLCDRWVNLLVSLCFIYHFVALEILYRMVYNSWGFSWLWEEKSFTKVGMGRSFHREGVGKNEYFCNNSGRARPILLIFELDRDIVKTELCRKFHRDRTLLSKVIV